jgi:Tol biopolymer transport system component
VSRSSYVGVRVGVLIAITLATAFCSPSGDRNPATLNCAFDAAQSLGPVVNSPNFDGSPTLSADETSLFFTSGRNGQQDLFVSIRPSKDAAWNEPVVLGNLINDSVADDFSLRLSADGKALYFASNRMDGAGAADLYVTTRESPRDEWGRATNLGPPLNTAAFEAFPTPSADGNTLYFNRSTTFDSADSDIWVTSRASAGVQWTAPQRLAAPVNGPRADFSPSISTDGLSLYFASDRDGNLGAIDIWVSTRERLTDSWRVPRNLGSNINAPAAMTLAPFISSDARALYFMSARPDRSSKIPCTPTTCFDKLDFYVAQLKCSDGLQR